MTSPADDPNYPADAELPEGPAVDPGMVDPEETSGDDPMEGQAPTG